MNQLKYFTRSGNLYTMKRQHGFSLVVIIGMGAAAIAGIFMHLPAVTWICTPLLILFVLATLLRRVVIDMDNRLFFLKSGLLRAGTNIPFEDLIHFQLASVKHNFITVNTSLNILYMKDGKERTQVIAEGFTIGAMQRVLNEIEEIIYPDGHEGTI